MADVNMKSNLGRIAKDKTSKKILIGVGVVAVLGIGYSYFGSRTSPANTNTVVDNIRSAPSVNGGDIGGNAPPQKYSDLIRNNDAQRIQEAKKTGASATPTIIMNNANDKTPLTLGTDNEHGMDDVTPSNNANNPLQQAEDNPLPSAPVVMGQQQQPIQTVQVDPNIVQAMAQKIQEIRTRKFGTAQTIYLYQAKVGNSSNNDDINTGEHTISSSKNLLGSNSKNPFNASSSGNLSSNGQGINASSGYTTGSRFNVPVAGTILASKLLGLVNSNINGPVLGEIQEGAFSGARLLGNFEFTQDGLILHFKTMTVSYTDDDGEKKAEVVKINALAVDSDNLSAGMATSIDRHIAERIAAQFGAAFLQGLGQAAAQSGATALVNPYGGTTVTNPTMTLTQQMLMATGTGASQAGSIFQSIYGNMRTTIKVKAGTPFGLLFTGDTNQ